MKFKSGMSQFGGGIKSGSTDSLRQIDGSTVRKADASR
jgi:hypothetical protein